MRDPRTLTWAQACALLEKAEQLHRQFFEPTREARQARWEPPIDVLETEHEIKIVAAMPGVPPEAVAVEVASGTLIIAGTRALPTCGEKSSIVRLEIPYGRFERRIALSFNRLRLAERELVNGCLVLTFVKLG